MRVLLVIGSILLMTGRAADLPSKEESAARRLYKLKCAKCHEFYAPQDYSESEWRTWMIKMKKKSHLKETDFELLLNYTLQLRKTPRDGDAIKRGQNQ